MFIKNVIKAERIVLQLKGKQLYKKLSLMNKYHMFDKEMLCDILNWFPQCCWKVYFHPKI